MPPKGTIMKKSPHTRKRTSKKITSEDLNKLSGGDRNRRLVDELRELYEAMNRNSPTKDRK